MPDPAARDPTRRVLSEGNLWFTVQISANGGAVSIRRRRSHITSRRTAVSSVRHLVAPRRADLRRVGANKVAASSRKMGSRVDSPNAKRPRLSRDYATLDWYSPTRGIWRLDPKTSE